MSVITNKDIAKGYHKNKKVAPKVKVNPCCVFPPCRIQPTNEFKMVVNGEEKIVWLCGQHQ